MSRVTSLSAPVLLLPFLAWACNRTPAAESETSSSGARTAAKSTPNAARTQSVTVDGDGFHPSEIKAKAGENLTLVFRRVTDATCAKAVVFKDLGLRKELPLNQDVQVAITAKGPKLDFACGMDMLRGSVVVE